VPGLISTGPKTVRGSGTNNSRSPTSIPKRDLLSHSKVSINHQRNVPGLGPKNASDQRPNTSTPLISAPTGGQLKHPMNGPQIQQKNTPLPNGQKPSQRNQKNLSTMSGKLQTTLGQKNLPMMSKSTGPNQKHKLESATTKQTQTGPQKTDVSIRHVPQPKPQGDMRNKEPAKEHHKLEHHHPKHHKPEYHQPEYHQPEHSQLEHHRSQNHRPEHAIPLHYQDSGNGHKRAASGRNLDEDVRDFTQHPDTFDHLEEEEQTLGENQNIYQGRKPCEDDYNQSPIQIMKRGAATC
jgi:hypothetical protein